MTNYIFSKIPNPFGLQATPNSINNLGQVVGG